MEEAGRRCYIVSEGDERIMARSIVFFLFAQIRILYKTCVG